MTESILGTYLYLLFIVNVTLLVGLLLLHKLQIQFKNNHSYFFSVFTVGIITIITSVSTLITYGKTINSLVLILLIILYFTHKKKNNSYITKKNELSYKNIIETNIVATTFFILYCYIYFHNRELFIGLPSRDLNFYSRLSSHIINYQTESNFFNYTNNSSPAPYHYFDIWINGLISKLHKSSLVNYVLITTPFLLTVFYLGVKNLLHNYLQTNLFVYFAITCFILLITGIYIYDIYSNSSLMGMANVFSKNAVCYQKLLPMYLFILWVFYFLKERKYELFYITLTLISIYYISSVVAIFSLFCCTTIYLIFTKNKKELNKIIIPFVFVVFVICFYQIFASKSALRMDQVVDFRNIYSFQNIKTSFNIFVKTNIQLFVLYFYLLLVFIINYKLNLKFLYEYKKQITILCFIYTLALISWCIFNHVYDSVQFFGNVTVSLLNIASGLFIIKNYIEAETRIKKNSVLVVSFLVLYFSYLITLLEFKPNSNYQEKALQQFQTKFYPSLKGKKIANMKSQKYFNTLYEQAGDFSVLSPQLLIIDDFEYYLINFGEQQTFKNVKEMYRDNKIIESSLFYKFCINNMYEDNIAKLQVKFIKENKIQVLVTTNDYVLSDEINEMVINSIKDEETEEIIYLLKI